MMLKRRLGTAAVSHVLVEWRRRALASFGLSACPNTPTLYQGMRLIGPDSIGNTKSEEQLFSDSSRCMQ